MRINRAHRYELDPNVVQFTLLAKHAGVARFAYNWGLARRIALWEQEKKCTNAIEQHRELNRLKRTEFPWMYEVSKCAPQEALRDLDRAFRNFFRGLKTGRKVGFPKFKRKWRRDSFRLTGVIRVLERHVQLPRLGNVRVKETTAVRGRILSATVSREADRWFVSFTVEQEIADPEPVAGPAVGIDVGLTHFATVVGSDGEVVKVEPPKPLNRYLKLLRRRQRKHSRKQKGSHNRQKSALRLARLHRRIHNIRGGFPPQALHGTGENQVSYRGGGPERQRVAEEQELCQAHCRCRLGRISSATWVQDRALRIQARCRKSLLPQQQNVFRLWRRAGQDGCGCSGVDLS